jgi:arginyl-tRNA synthetase
MSEQDLFSRIREHVLKVLLDRYPDLSQKVIDRIEIAPAPDPKYLASNAALVASGAVKQPPGTVAAAVSDALRASSAYEDVLWAPPGFINIEPKPATLQDVLRTILRAGASYGDSTAGQGVRVNVEYVSANPTGPMHIGHCRGAVVGDALANLLAKAGYAITKEFYINDAGAQVAALAWATYWRYLQALGTRLTEQEFAAQVSGGLQYRGEYLVPLGDALARAHGDALAGPGLAIADPASWFDEVREFAVGEMMAMIRDDLAALGVRHDVFTSEQALLESGAVDAAIERLRAHGLIYEGVLEPPKGKLPDDWEPREQTLFRATRFGDDVDRPLRKSDGSNTYFANDIAYHADKIARGAELLVNVWGADHGGYVKRMQAAVRALAPDERVRLDVLLCQIVHVVRGGAPVRMSKRAGTYVTLRDLIDEVGRDAVRFTMLTRKNDAQMEFDLDQVVAQTRDNPVFYVQYAHARCRSVLRLAGEQLGAAAVAETALAEAPLDSLSDPAELALMRRLAGWPRLVAGAAQAREPHRIAFFLYDLAGDFHILWNRGRDDSTLRFLQADRPAETRARLALVATTAVVIRSGLAVMGVTPVEEMR